MFETDFPHPTCLYPDSLERAAETLAKVEPDVRRKVLSTNASSLYRIPID
jgi:predicted TIM-barrel fold metal-dependent hydrolase